MGKVKDLKGSRFGRLLVSDLHEIRREYNKTKAYWLCLCDCGNEKWIRGDLLTGGDVVSCGCYRKENNSKLMKKRAKIKNLSGKRYGKLIVLDDCRNNSDGRHEYKEWLCLCECGKKVWVRANRLSRGKIYSCGCYKKENEKENKEVRDLSGEKFGRLTISSQCKRVKSGKGVVTKWLCYCDCGNEKWIQMSSLVCRNKPTRSCGCLAKEGVSKANSKELGHAAMNAIYSQYRSGAKRRKLSFKLNRKEFKMITKQKCFYCGSDLSNFNHAPNYNGDFVYNGIDRLDSNKGYEIGNCVPCCFICNRAKSVMSKRDFLKWIEKVYKFNNKNTEAKNE